MHFQSSYLLVLRGDLSGIIDLVANKAYLYKNDLGTDIEEAPIPSDMEEEAAEWRFK